LEQATASNLIVTTGGISVGAHDHVRTIVAASGSIDFWRVQMRPGAQTGAGSVRGIPWIGLPGNPVSALVTGEIFVRAAVMRMSGVAAVHRVPVRVTLGERVTTAGGATHLLRATVHRDGGTLTARLTGPQGTGLLSSVARADVLLVVPADVTSVDAGEIVSALPLGPSEMAERLMLEAPR
jgi:molybdopterin molybdotransferase